MESTSNLVAVVIALVSAVAAISGGVFTYRASTKQTTTEADTKRIDQVIEGMQRIIDNLSKENGRLATELETLRQQLFVVRGELNASELERIKALKNFEKLEEKYENLKDKLKSTHVIEENGKSI